MAIAKGLGPRVRSVAANTFIVIWLGDDEEYIEGVVIL